ncbi:unnamed protein product [Adineta ricciae]|uniref:Sugar phosphate transporter domain-containing protein n=1 Tax=Adineta ricciae TaxID=249248 RepID=A0A814MU41_ADIRI|nr:unnamed protein product [Adineta ricciae]CAF1082566.1 unnamed protein product [Adineta ricciae]
MSFTEKDYQRLENVVSYNDVSIETLQPTLDSSVIVNDSFQSTASNKTCFCSTLVFTINFVSSILIINLSKWIYVKHHFPNLTLTTINFFTSFALLYLCLLAKLFTYKRLPIIRMLPVSACFAGFIAFGNLSLQYNTVGTYQLIKLQVTPTVMLISWLYFKSRYSLPIVLSFMPVLIGTLFSTYYDLQFNIFGLICAGASVVFTAINQILVEHYQKEYDCNSLQLLFYQAPLSGVLLLTVIPYFEPLDNLSRIMHPNTILLVLLCGFIAFFVNVSVFWVIGNLSAVAYNMIGHSKTLLIIFIGSILFHEPFNQRQMAGLAFTMCGVLMYSYFKYGRAASPPSQ